MIKSKTELQHYLAEDKSRYKAIVGKGYLIYLLKLFIRSEDAICLHYLRVLRKYEYYHNTRSVLRLWYKIRHSILEDKSGISIPINVVGPGLYIAHRGGVIINCKSMGSHCIVSSGVVCGNKNTTDSVPAIGNNVELTLGCKVIGKLDIGDNVIVAPNSVVIKSVPANCVVSGVPAQIIKSLPQKNENTSDK